MFNKILIANRGEIAIRIIRTCRDMGVKTVAIYSEADREGLHVRFADEAYCVGPAPSSESYLNIDRLLEVARESKAEAVHPGYGFLSENAHFARTCQEAGLVFIGPSIEAIEKMGDKALARLTMMGQDVPLIPGTEKPHIRRCRHNVTLPGNWLPRYVESRCGRWRQRHAIVKKEQELEDAVRMVKREAFASFANSDILLEKYFDESRHIEIQIMADTHGNCIHLFERECSLQRRYQKVIEESPSPFMDDQLRQNDRRCN